MTNFQLQALVLTAIWLVLVLVRFRRSIPFLIGGLLVIGTFTMVALAAGWVKAEQLGFNRQSWLVTIGFAVVGCVVMLAYSPVADWIAGRFISESPNLEAFRALQQSKSKLIAGIVVAWILGGFFEELVVRGVVLRSIETVLSASLPKAIAVVVATCLAAVGAGVAHLYQGRRAVIVITQLSIFFGVVFVVSGNNLPSVMLCHGLYDTIAFIRFANKKSKYSKLEDSRSTK